MTSDKRDNCFPSGARITNGTQEAIVVDRFRNVLFVHFPGGGNKELIAWRVDQAIEGGWQVKPEYNEPTCPCCG